MNQGNKQKNDLSNREAILAVMDTTELVVKIRPEKTAFEPMPSAIPVQIESMQNDLYL